MKACVVSFPGSNCDRDAWVALQAVSGTSPIQIDYRDRTLPDEIGLIVIPGGFSFGDYLRCGALAACAPIMREIVRLFKRGAFVFGICNGFQILTEAGLLPGCLMANRSLRFISKRVAVRVENTQSTFTSRFKEGEVLSLPVAHHDGAYYAQKEVLRALEDNGQVALRYCEDVNGSAHNIAGIFDSTKRILGLMPHPERAWQKILGSADGARFFQGF